MKRLILSVRSQDGERVDEIVFTSERGALIIDASAAKSPIVALSALEGARFEDTEAAEHARLERARLTAVYLENDERKS